MLCAPCLALSLLAHCSFLTSHSGSPGTKTEPTTGPSFPRLLQILRDASRHASTPDAWCLTRGDGNGKPTPLPRRPSTHVSRPHIHMQGLQAHVLWAQGKAWAARSPNQQHRPLDFTLSSGGSMGRAVLRKEHTELPLCLGTRTDRVQTRACQPEAGSRALAPKESIAEGLPPSTTKPIHNFCTRNPSLRRSGRRRLLNLSPGDLLPTWPIILGPMILDD